MSDLRDDTLLLMARRFARRVLEYVGDGEDDAQLECDAELRAMARELLQALDDPNPRKPPAASKRRRRGA